MKRRSWLWFVASAILAIVAGVVVIIILRQATAGPAVEAEVRRQAVVVVLQPLDVNTILRADMLRLEERDDPPSGVAVRVQDVLGAVTLRPYAAGEPILMQDLRGARGQPTGQELPLMLTEDTIAVALPADDILSKWGTVVPGDHIDVFVTLDVLLETPLRPRAGVLYPEIEREQVFDHVSVLMLQNLEVLQIIEEPQTTQEGEGPPPLRNRALVLMITPQDASVLRYIQTVPDGEKTISLALRSPENTTLFDTEAVNINYILLRYGIDLPEEFQ
jgi:Flp pilus assembly protein CpaB